MLYVSIVWKKGDSIRSAENRKDYLHGLSTGLDNYEYKSEEIVTMNDGMEGYCEEYTFYSGETKVNVKNLIFDCSSGIASVMLGIKKDDEEDSNKYDDQFLAIRDSIVIDEEKTANEPIDLSIVDSVSVISGGYVNYTICVKNENKGYIAQFAHVKAVGKKEDGTIRFSKDWTIMALAPNQTTYWSTQVGDGDVTESDTIELSISVKDSDWMEYDATTEENIYTIENISVDKDNYGRTKATGEITLNADGKIANIGLTMPMVVCIFKDKNGKIIDGFSGFLFDGLSVAEKEAFQIEGYPKCETYDSVELYANPWM